jgi:hypothetical protein
MMLLMPWPKLQQPQQNSCRHFHPSLRQQQQQQHHHHQQQQCHHQLHQQLYQQMLQSSIIFHSRHAHTSHPSSPHHRTPCCPHPASFLVPLLFLESERLLLLLLLLLLLQLLLPLLPCQQPGTQLLISAATMI